MFMLLVFQLNQMWYMHQDLYCINNVKKNIPIHRINKSVEYMD
jgi:hypothetical protein